MTAHNELAIDIEAATAQLQEDVSSGRIEEQANIEAEAIETALDDSAEVPDSAFWEDGEDLGDSYSEASDSKSTDADADVPQNKGIITYKANGKDVSLNLNDLRNNVEAQQELTKKLALVDGARKAFSDKNKLRQRLKDAETSSSDLAKYKESWDKLEAMKEDPAELYKVLTGEDFESMVTRETEKRSIYSNASDEDQKIMDYEDRIRRMEIQSEREQARRNKDIEKAEAAKYAASKESMNTQLQKEFFKYEFEDSASPAAANKLRNMLWRNSVADVQDYLKQGYKFSDRMVNKAFKDNASAMQAFYKESIAKGTKQAATTQKANAQEKAAEAATKNYSTPDKKLDSLSMKDPISLFNAFRKGRR